ncbi:PP2C-domain-containing protein [Exidia glandulosa HHB12029]|uniref:protein-serine/threonine phosphatase n=1 Tax=Exidia glandulosa HHB12029 TaxID=1314781 RepID=A0A166BR52_EXIGL|nr:PP2C-domain-containing protein [Exidia glandulosa HHB12029]
MGQTLSQPITDKHSSSGADDRYLYAVSEMQGWRISMEDAHATVLRLADDDDNTFFAVYDGHGGASVARYSGRNVHKRLVNEESYHEKRYEKALKQAFLGTDEDMRADPAFMHDPSGCTAVAALIADGKIYVANAGDSRSVLSHQGTAKPLSYDHKPQNEIETQRIKAAGGYIEYGRVNGNLALSRALGDFDFKKNYSLGPEKQVITADPDITVHELTDEDEFFVIACDGIWDCLSSQQVINIVRRQVAEGKELADVCEVILDRCLSQDSSIQGGIGCDNMTLIIIALLRGRTKEEWYAWVKERVERGHGFPTPAGLPELYPHHRAAFQPSRQNGVVSRGLGGGIAFYPGTGLFDTSSYQYDSEDSEPDGEHEHDDFEDEPNASAKSDASAADAGKSAEAEADGESASTFTIRVPPAKQVDVIPATWRDTTEDAEDTDSVMTEDGDEEGEGTKLNGQLLGAHSKWKVVGSPLLPSPEPLAQPGVKRDTTPLASPTVAAPSPPPATPA